MSNRLRCPRCQSKSFRTIDGQRTCKNGHVQTGYVQQMSDEFVEGARSVYKSGKRKKKDKEPVSNDSRFYPPRRIRFEMAQSSLRDMTQCLISTKDFPQQFEIVVLDLWLKLITAYPLSMASRNRRAWKRSDSISNGTISESETSGWTDDEDPVESDTTASSLRSLQQTRGSGHVRILREFKTKYLLGILYLGSLWLKMPYVARDFTRWANNGEIPYYFTCKLHDESLNKGYSVEKSGMEDRTIPEDDLNWVVLQLKSFYNSKFEIKFPTLNIKAFQDRVFRILNLDESRITMVADISQRIGTLETEIHVIIPFLIEYKIWISSNPSRIVKIPHSTKEYAKLSTMDLKSDTSRWQAYSEFCQNLFDMNVLKKETRIAMEALGQSSFGSVSPSSTPIGYTDIRTESAASIQSYHTSDRIGMFPFSYGLILEFLADLIGICPQKLEKRVHQKEHLLDIFS